LIGEPLKHIVSTFFMVAIYQISPLTG